MDTVNGMRLFTTVVEAGSFHRAAEQLGITPSAVSKQLSRLEDRLGARLLNRTTRRLGLTEVGAGYYERCKRILAEIEEAEEAVSESLSVPRGLLRLSVPTAFGRVQIAPLLPGFLRQYPKIRISAFSHDRDVDLIQEGYDVAIRVATLQDSSMIARRLTANRRVVCATPDYFRAHGVPRTPEELKRHNCLLNTVYSPHRVWSFNSPAGHHAVQVAGSLEFDNPLALWEAARTGLGVVLLPAYAVQRDLEEGVLEAVLDDYVSEDPDVYVVYPHARHLNPKVRVFVDYLLEHFRSREAARHVRAPRPAREHRARRGPA